MAESLTRGGFLSAVAQSVAQMLIAHMKILMVDSAIVVIPSALLCISVVVTILSLNGGVAFYAVDPIIFSAEHLVSSIGIAAFRVVLASILKAAITVCAVKTLQSKKPHHHLSHYKRWARYLSSKLFTKSIQATFTVSLFLLLTPIVCGGVAFGIVVLGLRFKSLALEITGYCAVLGFLIALILFSGLETIVLPITILEKCNSPLHALRRSYELSREYRLTLCLIALGTWSLSQFLDITFKVGILGKSPFDIFLPTTVFASFVPCIGYLPIGAVVSTCIYFQLIRESSGSGTKLRYTTKKSKQWIWVLFFFFFVAFTALIFSLSSLKTYAYTQEEHSENLLTTLDTSDLFVGSNRCQGMDCIDARVPTHLTPGCPFFGSHHKMGVYLSVSLMIVMCPRKVIRELSVSEVENRVCHFRPEHYRDGVPHIHIIRDPLETVISAYQYHLVSNEMWLQEKGVQKRLKHSSLEDGLEFEYQMTMADVVRDAVETHEFLMEHARTNIFTVRMEHIRDEFGFRATVYAIERWLGLSHLTWWTLKRCCYLSKKQREKGGTRHVSDLNEKLEMRRIIMDRHANEIEEARRRLGFPLVGLER